MGVLLGNGDGRSGGPDLLYDGRDGTPHEIAVTDFNGDGAADVVAVECQRKVSSGSLWQQQAGDEYRCSDAEHLWKDAGAGNGGANRP